jgi:hypothetical protein
VYVDTTNAIYEIVSQLKDGFNMKDLGETTFCLGLKVEHRAINIILHHRLYTQKLLKRFLMDAAYLLNYPIVVWSLDL